MNQTTELQFSFALLMSVLGPKIKTQSEIGCACTMGSIVFLNAEIDQRCRISDRGG